MTSTSTSNASKIPRYEDPGLDKDNYPSKPGLIHDIHMHHQISHLHFAYLNSTWVGEGLTTLFLSYAPDLTELDNANRVSELRFHFRGGSKMKITQVQVATIQPNLVPCDTNTTLYQPIISDIPILGLNHVDPLAKVLTKPHQTISPLDLDPDMDDPTDDTTRSGTKRRFEADTQYTRGGQGMMDALRAKAMASNLGEVQITFRRPEQIVTSDISEDAEWKKNVYLCWRQELQTTSLGHKTNKEAPTVPQELQKRLNTRNSKRREKRLDWICRTLGEERTKMALKVTIQYKWSMISGPTHLGGIHFYTSMSRDARDTVPSFPTTPHVYTTSGILGDHQGTRCWLPTLDSARWNHRCSHEISIAVTAKRDEGLWATGCGEDFGLNDVVMYPTPRGRDTDNILSALIEILGKSYVSFITESIETSERILDDTVSHSKQLSSLPDLATAMWVSALWNPAPSRSLGFAIGPFRVVYDREYYYSADETDDDANGEKMNIDKGKVYTAFKLAVKRGEGIRQLYFADVKARCSIHRGRTLLRTADNSRAFTLIMQSCDHSISDSNLFTLLNPTERAIVASTDGVPMRALTLVRGILSLPRFRSSSYTQIWIPLAVDGGSSSGAWNTYPEAICNSFIGGAIFDSSLLNPPSFRMPFYSGGRALQFLQARAAINGWITAAIPLGGDDDIGHSYIHRLFECLLMSFYERSNGAFGEGGSKMSFFFCERYAKKSGLKSPNIDFLPIYNIEEDAFNMNATHGATGMAQVEDRNHEHLWRSSLNGTESHTSALDEFSVRQLINKDVLEGFERTDKSLPSMNWLGSHLCATFLSSNSSSSTALGCGAVELVHPSGGIAYRYFKCQSIRRIVESRCGTSNFVRVLRAVFIASLLKDLGENKIELLYLNEKDKLKWIEDDGENVDLRPKQPFLICMEELLKEGGITHGLLTRCLRLTSGILRDQYLRGTLLDISKESYESNRRSQHLEPEGFPNSFIRGCSGLYLRVGAFVEPAGANEAQIQSSSNITKGTHLQLMAEPVIPNGGIAYGGPVTVRVIENEGQVREFLRVLRSDGSRADWGPIYLHAKPVTTARQQKAASGLVDSAPRKSEADDANIDIPQNASQDNKTTVTSSTGDTAFDSNQLHTGGYQALELIRLTNRTPLLWLRIDPHGLYDGRVSIFIPDACLGEQLFHDGEASSQVDAARALAERPLKIQGSVNILNVYDVPVTELPVRLLGDCLRGSVALHADLPHNPCIRSQAALAIAQWQNNKAPASKDIIGVNEWIGLNLLLQYFNERFYRDSSIIPVKYTRISVHGQRYTSNKNGHQSNEAMNDDEYIYIDSLVEDFDDRYLLEVEEDEEYRVRSCCLRAIACCRAKDGQTPPIVIKFFERLLYGNMPSSMKALSLEEEEILKRKIGDFRAIDDDRVTATNDIENFLEISYCCSSLIADSLLALCYIVAKCDFNEDPSTGKIIPSNSIHPCMGLLEACCRWLEWDTYREKIRLESVDEISLGIGGSFCGTVATCAITAISSLAILIQSSSDDIEERGEAQQHKSDIQGKSTSIQILNKVTKAQFYADILKSNLYISDKISAAAAQALVCIYCASDRLKQAGEEPIGLLSALEVLLQCIHDSRASPGLRQSFAALMMDACTGKICSNQRAALAALDNDLLMSASRFYCGPLGASYGGDNGSAIFLSVSENTAPAASAVNDGARIGLRLLSRAGQNNDVSDEVVSRVAIFASCLWRTINGEIGGNESSSFVFTPVFSTSDGVCAHDGFLRSSLLALWQWIWPKGCFAVMRVQAWADHEGTQRYRGLGAELVMKITEEEKDALSLDDSIYNQIRSLVSVELDRQQWRGRMAAAAYELYKENGDQAKDSIGLNHPLGTIEKDSTWKLGGWVASTAAQRRAAGTDGGTATKIRLIAKQAN